MLLRLRWAGPAAPPRSPGGRPPGVTPRRRRRDPGRHGVGAGGLGVMWQLDHHRDCWAWAPGVTAHLLGTVGRGRVLCGPARGPGPGPAAAGDTGLTRPHRAGLHRDSKSCFGQATSHSSSSPRPARAGSRRRPRPGGPGPVGRAAGRVPSQPVPTGPSWPRAMSGPPLEYDPSPSPQCGMIMASPGRRASESDDHAGPMITVSHPSRPDSDDASAAVGSARGRISDSDDDHHAAPRPVAA
jgi:hypothetical protein